MQLITASPFSEGRGTIARSVGTQPAVWNNNNATALSDTWVQVPFVNGAMIYAPQINGNNYWTMTKYTNLFVDNATEMSISVWVYCTAYVSNIGGQCDLFDDDRQNAATAWVLGENGASGSNVGTNTRTIWWYVQNFNSSTSQTIYAPANSFNLNQWYHLAATIDKLKVMRLYMNGVQVATGTAPDYPYSGFSQPLGLGAAGVNGNGRFQGYMVMPMYWRQRALTPPEVLDLYTNPFGVLQPPRTPAGATFAHTYSDIVTLGAEAGLTPIGTHIITKLISLGVAAGMSETAILRDLYLALGARAGVTPSALRTVAALLDLGVKAGITPASLLNRPYLVLGTKPGIALKSVLTSLNKITLPEADGITLLNNASMAFDVRLGVAAGAVELTGTRPDVELVWKYGKWTNSSYKQLVQGVNDTTKTSAFVGYEVQVWSGSTPTGLVLRRGPGAALPADIVTTESYTYSEATNVADAGAFQRYMKFQIRVYENTGYYSEPEIINVHVVS